jgi:hypothetical protein
VKLALATTGSVTESRCEMARPWRRPEPPAAILAIRLQAIGDVTVTLPEALAIVQRAALVLTEDCGLMHMAWVSPLGEHSRCLYSGDRPCGACMESACRFGDVHCLTRYSPEDVVREAECLIARAAGRTPLIPEGDGSINAMSVSQMEISR